MTAGVTEQNPRPDQQSKMRGTWHVHFALMRIPLLDGIERHLRAEGRPLNAAARGAGAEP